jgi:site-specific recombinase XerD
MDSSNGPRNLVPTSSFDLGKMADELARDNQLANHQAGLSPNTRRRQRAEIAQFEAYMGLTGMYDDLAQWQYVTFGIIESYKKKLLLDGYRISTINLRLATITSYCDLAAKAGYYDVKPDDSEEVRQRKNNQYALICSVKGISARSAIYVDDDRKKAGLDTAKSTKKHKPTALKPAHVEKLKDQPDTPDGRRDRLIICLLFDHGLRCSEIVALDVASISDLDPALQTGILHIQSIKTRTSEDQDDKAELTPDTFNAFMAYQADIAPDQEALFIGKISKKRVDERSVYHRVKLAGERIGLTMPVSPHDGRHFMVDDAFANENDLATIKRAGRWRTDTMPLKYATSHTITNKGLKLSAIRKHRGV